MPQDHRYTMVARSADGNDARVIGSMLDYAFAPSDHERVISMLTDSATRIVSLIITEGGYNVDDKTGQFNGTNASVQDHAHRADAPPRTAFGRVCEALSRRRAEMQHGLPAR